MDDRRDGPRLLVFSGAGLSAESGVPTFRGVDGLWQGHRIDEVCDFITCKKNAPAVHSFYNGLRSALAEARPNSAHVRLAGWQKAGKAKLITANVDDLLERAGVTEVMHVHGELKAMHCMRPSIERRL